MGRLDCSILRLHGIGLGWIRLHHQLAAITRLCPDPDGPLLSEALCQLYHMVCHWNIGKHADPLCGFLANQE
jgi:hypothetical protein